MRTWDKLIEIEADQVLAESRERLSAILEVNDHISMEIGSDIDQILNNVTRKEMREWGPVEVARTDQTLKRWEVTFSVVNMANRGIVRLTLEGYYLQAVSLLRQELEGVAQLKHITLGTRPNGKAPNIKVLDERLRKVYRELSQGTHLTSDQMAALQAPLLTGRERLIAQLPHGPSLLPRFSHHVAKTIFEIHVELRKALKSILHEHIEKIRREP